jgi:hypothetical protein
VPSNLSKKRKNPLRDELRLGEVGLEEYFKEKFGGKALPK